MQEESVSLQFKQGGSDKVYGAQLVQLAGAWTVLAQWGRSGSSLQSVEKVSGVAYDKAKGVFDRLVKEKLAKGYEGVEGSGVAAAQGNYLAVVVSA